MLRPASLPALLLCLLLWGCPSAPAAPDAGEGPGAEDGGALDAGALDAGGDDAGPDDDDGGLFGDGDAGDAGESCAFPPLEPPADAVPDAGEQECTLVDTRSIGDYEGTWEGQVYGSFPISGPFDLPASGEMVFSIYCGDDKLLVDGELSGRAYQHADAGPDEPGHPFSGRMFGELEPESGQLILRVDPATLQVGPFFGTFKVAMTGLRQEDNSFEAGSWCGVTVEPEGGAGEGTWRADPATEDLP